MLCDACQLHFDFRSQDYTAVKKATIEELCKAGAPASLVETLNLDLQLYKNRRRHLATYDHANVCPWISPSQLHPDTPKNIVEELEEYELDVWQEGPWKQSVHEGCEMCLGLYEVIRTRGFDPDFVNVESWLIVEPITCWPSKIKMLIIEQVDDLDSYWVYFRFRKTTLAHGEALTE
ncbi:hypothetical protein BCR34DRAFT_50101 [Clohesyomyces aquaticus]|uniref:Uncharacterized protein n=1 Tax=Clohesyomyces aquaticus TaxID=1231657 RepID=A0A1Y2A3Y8_9PLEO|nr:hypothetical protein BCR34DRAFT_50101 [Clohesyomyces aquaticus]